MEPVYKYLWFASFPSLTENSLGDNLCFHFVFVQDSQIGFQILSGDSQKLLQY